MRTRLEQALLSSGFPCSLRRHQGSSPLDACSETVSRLSRASGEALAAASNSKLPARGLICHYILWFIEFVLFVAPLAF
jgi:hypothetical protein